MKLYEILGDMEALCDTDAEFDDNALAIISRELEKKTDSIGMLVRSINSDIDAIKAEEKRLADKRKALENREKQIKEYVLHQMKEHNLETFKGGIFTFSRQASPPSLVIADESKLPARFFDIIPEQKVVNKTRVKEALKDGNDLNGAAYTEAGEHLRIK